MARRSRNRSTKNFMDELAYNSGRTWRDYCDLQEPKIGSNGFLIGHWGDAIVAAVQIEKAGFSDAFADGPAGQVLEHLQTVGFGRFMEAADKTEAAAHAQNARPVPSSPSRPTSASSRPPRQSSRLASSDRVVAAPWDKTFDDAQNGVGAMWPQSDFQATGRKRALLIGINYYGTSGELRGCINDVQNMQQLLIQTYGWRPSDIRTLTDDGNGGGMPTYKNIEDEMRRLSDGAMPGDVLFFHFSGHGAQQVDPNGYEEDGCNETILPVDFKSAGMMTDDRIGDFIVKPLPEGVKLTAVMDCCHSGTGLDLPFTWTASGWREEVNPYHSKGDVQMFSGCEDGDTSSDAANLYGAPGGAMTTAFCDVLRRNPHPTYPQLLDEMNSHLRSRGFRQRPQLSSSQAFRFDRPFSLSDIHPNMNQTLGRTFRQKFPPQPRQITGPLADMLGAALMVAGSYVVGAMVGSAVAEAAGFFADMFGA